MRPVRDPALARITLFLLLVLTACMTPASARADDPAAADTTLGDYLHALADSSDAHFGPVTASIDTTGLDSSRVYAFAHPERWGYRRKQRVAFFPVADFNRVDGPALGAGAAFGSALEWGKLSGQWAYATGPNLSLGTVAYLKRLEQPTVRWDLKAFGGRTTSVMNREDRGHSLSALSAFVSGGDHSHYLRQDGVTARLSREGVTHRLAVGYRNELESPRVTTATWNLRHKRPAIVGNLPATLGRASELSYELLWRVPRTPVTAQALHATSSRSIGSDFEYRRTLVSAGADIGIGRTFAVVPQVEYGGLTGDGLPQAAFYLGGSHTLRSLPYAVTGGSRLALARLDVLMVRDVLEVLHVPHPAAFPLQLGTFAATGAVWGRDPYTGLVRPGVDWPNVAEWRHEAGVSVMWQPGIPDPAMFVRVNWAKPIGPGAHEARIAASIGRGLDLLKSFERE